MSWFNAETITIKPNMLDSKKQALALMLKENFKNNGDGKSRRILNFFTDDHYSSTEINMDGETTSVKINPNQIITKRHNVETSEVYYEVSGKLLGEGLYGWVYAPGFRIIPNSTHDNVEIIKQQGDNKQVAKIQKIVAIPRKGSSKAEEKERILKEEASVRDVYQEEYNKVPIDGFDFNDKDECEDYRISFMPFFQGKDLGRYSINDFNYAERVFLMTAILKAYVKLEDQQVVHQDPKADNIIFDKKNWTVNFADFGHAHRWNEGYRYDGNNKHMPPEMLDIGREVKANIKAGNGKKPLAKAKPEYHKIDYYFLSGVLGKLFNANNIYLHKNALTTMGGFGHFICRIFLGRNPAHVDLRKLSASRNYNFTGMFQGLHMPKQHKKILGNIIKKLGAADLNDRPNTIAGDVLLEVMEVQQQCLKANYHKMSKAIDKAEMNLELYLDKYKYENTKDTVDIPTESKEWAITKKISAILKNNATVNIDGAVNAEKNTLGNEDVDFALVAKMIQVNHLLAQLEEQQQAITKELNEGRELSPINYEKHYIQLKNMLTDKNMLKNLNNYRSKKFGSLSGFFNTIAKPFGVILNLFYSAEDKALVSNVGYVWSDSANSVYHGLKLLRESYYSEVTSKDISKLNPEHKNNRSRMICAH